jgi:recombinational DNA repair protein RecT
MMLLAPEANLELHGVTLVGYSYVMMYGMKVQIVTPYRVSHNITALRYAVRLQVCSHF